MDRGGDLLWTCQGVGRRNRQNIPQGMKGICCNQSDRGASQPAKDASPPAGTPQAPRDASLVEHTNDRGAIQPAFDNMCANKINVAIIIIVVQPVCLYRRTPFMIPGLYVVASHQQQQVNIQDTKPHSYLVYAMCTIYRSL